MLGLGVVLADDSLMKTFLGFPYWSRDNTQSTRKRNSAYFLLQSGLSKAVRKLLPSAGMACMRCPGFGLLSGNFH